MLADIWIKVDIEDIGNINHIKERATLAGHTLTLRGTVEGKGCANEKRYGLAGTTATGCLW